MTKLWGGFKIRAHRILPLPSHFFQPVHVMIRIATNQDAQGVIDLISSCYSEYGDLVCLEPGGAEAELLDIETHYRGRGGEFWVLDLDGEICGSHATVPFDDHPEICGFRRLYLKKSLRGNTDWGHRLMQVTIDWARNQGFREVQFWSDTRFERAHQFFGKFGFIPDGRVREMHDSHEPYSEYFFSLKL